MLRLPSIFTRPTIGVYRSPLCLLNVATPAGHRYSVIDPHPTYADGLRDSHDTTGAPSHGVVFTSPLDYPHLVVVLMSGSMSGIDYQLLAESDEIIAGRDAKVVLRLTSAAKPLNFEIYA